MDLLLMRATYFLELMQTTSRHCSDSLRRRLHSRTRSASSMCHRLGFVCLPWGMVSALLIFSILTIGTGQTRCWNRRVSMAMTGE